MALKRGEASVSRITRTRANGEAEEAPRGLRPMGR